MQLRNTHSKVYLTRYLPLSTERPFLRSAYWSKKLKKPAASSIQDAKTGLDQYDVLGNELILFGKAIADPLRSLLSLLGERVSESSSNAAAKAAMVELCPVSPHDIALSRPRRRLVSRQVT